MRSKVQSGTGKTTIARLIAAEVADEFCIQEVDAASLTVSQLRDLEREMNVMGWGKGGRAYLVNEAHALRAAQGELVVTILLPDED
jgi:replication-associated recombination protein RarA